MSRLGVTKDHHGDEVRWVVGILARVLGGLLAIVIGFLLAALSFYVTGGIPEEPGEHAAAAPCVHACLSMFGQMPPPADEERLRDCMLHCAPPPLPGAVP